MRVIRTIVLGSLLLVPALGTADTFTPSHYCTKPIRPYRFNSEFEIQQFQYDVERYKQCIEDFVEEQEDAIKKHQEAAEDAIDEWNSFVSTELQ